MFLLRVDEALKAARVPYALVGGYAVALHGAVRGTIDVDLVLRFREADFVRAEKALNGIGLRSRLPVSAVEVFRFRDEYIRNRNLHAWTLVNPDKPSEIVDVVLTRDLTKMNTRRVRVGGRGISLASLEDLIEMKSGTGRAQDTEDVKALERLR
ncbi:MAG: nucleotidyltransferase domain-containing protein [Planctomycetota bacterium]|jgi:hypothetical protein